MLIYPTQIKDGSIFVDIAVGGTAKIIKGGVGTSLESSNVYGLEPRVYLDGTDPDDPTNNSLSLTKSTAGEAVTFVVSLIGLGILATAGTAFFLFYENFTALIIFWILTFSVFAAYVYSTRIKG
jgi:hypothetical protein